MYATISANGFLIGGLASHTSTDHVSRLFVHSFTASRTPQPATPGRLSCSIMLM